VVLDNVKSIRIRNILLKHFSIEFYKETKMEFHISENKSHVVQIKYSKKEDTVKTSDIVSAFLFYNEKNKQKSEKMYVYGDLGISMIKDKQSSSTWNQLFDPNIFFPHWEALRRFNQIKHKSEYDCYLHFDSDDAFIKAINLEYSSQKKICKVFTSIDITTKNEGIQLQNIKKDELKKCLDESDFMFATVSIKKIPSVLLMISQMKVNTDCLLCIPNTFDENIIDLIYGFTLDFEKVICFRPSCVHPLDKKYYLILSNKRAKCPFTKKIISSSTKLIKNKMIIKNKKHNKSYADICNFVKKINNDVYKQLYVCLDQEKIVFNKSPSWFANQHFPCIKPMEIYPNKKYSSRVLPYQNKHNSQAIKKDKYDSIYLQINTEHLMYQTLANDLDDVYIKSMKLIKEHCKSKKINTQLSQLMLLEIVMDSYIFSNRYLGNPPKKSIPTVMMFPSGGTKFYVPLPHYYRTVKHIDTKYFKRQDDVDLVVFGIPPITKQQFNKELFAMVNVLPNGRSAIFSVSLPIISQEMLIVLDILRRNSVIMILHKSLLWNIKKPLIFVEIIKYYGWQGIDRRDRDVLCDIFNGKNIEKEYTSDTLYGVSLEIIKFQEICAQTQKNMLGFILSGKKDEDNTLSTNWIKMFG
jgi:hypothetical protein